MSAPVELEKQIECVRREIAFRERLYPRWVESNRINPVRAEHELKCMRAVLETLLKVEAERR